MKSALKRDIAKTTEIGRTRCQGIELLYHQRHVVRPRDREAAGAHQVGDALGVIVRQGRDLMQASAGIDGRAEAQS